MKSFVRPVAQVLLAAGIVVAVVTPASAGAPDPVLSALAKQRAFGYTPCEPEILDLYEPLSPGKLGAADNGEESGHCAIWLKPGLSPETLEWVVWHEVCHLSTVHDIWEQRIPGQPDPAHKHPLFLACLAHGPADRGGY